MVTVFYSGKRPDGCPYGHEWGPGRIIVGYMPCECARPYGRLGHHWVRCRGDDDKCPAVWYDLPHRPDG